MSEAKALGFPRWLRPARGGGMTDDREPAGLDPFALLDNEAGRSDVFFSGHPERPVERIEFIPRGGRFVVAGITTSDVDEHPFVRAAAT
jgi:hypothetical protein